MLLSKQFLGVIEFPYIRCIITYYMVANKGTISKKYSYEDSKPIHSWATEGPVSVWEKDKKYTVKYSRFPEGKVLFLTIYPESSPNTDSISM